VYDARIEALVSDRELASTEDDEDDVRRLDPVTTVSCNILEGSIPDIQLAIDAVSATMLLLLLLKVVISIPFIV
jgi:hypothetical protein